jgi:hypothetical protein
LNFRAGAVIYYVPEPHSLLLVLTAVSTWFLAPRRPLWHFPRGA